MASRLRDKAKPISPSPGVGAARASSSEIGHATTWENAMTSGGLFSTNRARLKGQRLRVSSRLRRF
eukprot:3281054-Alexandrium_andersonii.AAC.1